MDLAPFDAFAPLEDFVIEVRPCGVPCGVRPGLRQGLWRHGQRQRRIPQRPSARLPGKISFPTCRAPRNPSASRDGALKLLLVAPNQSSSN
jgi:hypothetical protein